MQTTPQTGRRQRWIWLVLVLIVAACGSEPDAARPVELLPWELDVPADLPVRAYWPATAEERAGQHIRLVEDLVLGSEDDPQQQFGYIGDVAADERGRIYVVDRPNTRVQVFERDGQHAATLGRSGQGPGEFESPRNVVVADGRVGVSDEGKISWWSTADLSFLGDVVVEGNLGEVYAELPDGATLASLMEFDPNGMGMSPSGSVTIVVVVGPLLASGALRETFFRLPVENEPTLSMGSSWSYFENSPHPFPWIVAAPDARIYYTRSSEYQLMALDPGGQLVWALQVPAPRTPTDAELRADLLGWAQERIPEAVDSNLNAPEFMPAIRRLRVDGAGRLHVYGFVPEWANPEVERPVDVYTPDGERIFTGYAPAEDWTYARGDHVYGIGTDPVTEEYRVYRWRLEAPFIDSE